MTEKKIERINDLAHKKKEHGLTAAEQEEQKKLYEDFLADIRSQVKNQLEAAGYTKKNNGKTS